MGVFSLLLLLFEVHVGWVFAKNACYCVKVWGWGVCGGCATANFLSRFITQPPHLELFPMARKKRKIKIMLNQPSTLSLPLVAHLPWNNKTPPDLRKSLTLSLAVLFSLKRDLICSKIWYVWLTVRKIQIVQVIALVGYRDILEGRYKRFLGITKGVSY